jgi:hypothetical protein
MGNYSSDMFRLLSVVGAYEYAGGGHKFCAEHFLRPKVWCCTNGAAYSLTLVLLGDGGNTQVASAN